MNLQIPKSAFFLLLGVSLVLVVLIMFVVFSLFSKPSSTPSNQQAPTPIPTLSVPENQRSSIEVINTSPPENTSGEVIVNPSQRVSFTTSEDLSPSDIEVKVSPNIPLSVEKNTDGSIAIFPTPPDFWVPNVLYAITIFDSADKIITKYQIKVPQYIPQEVVD